MAKVLGEKSRYLIWNDYAGRFGAIMTIFFLAYLIIIWYRNAETVKGGAGVVFLVVFLLVFFWIRNKGNRYIDDFSRFKQGRHGEYDICDELAKLPDDFTIFQDVKFPEERWNIDLVVVGPTGVFAIEVKSHNGRIAFDGNQLTRNGLYISGKNFLTQTMNGTMKLNEYVFAKTGRKIFIDPVLAFSGRWASMRFGFNKVKGVFVVQRRFLNELIQKNSGVLSPDDRLLLEGVLRDLVVIKEPVA